MLREAVLPYLRELGDRWERGDASIGQEHFASAVLRGRLLGLARGWGRGGGAHALLACAPGDHYDLALTVFGLALRDRNWRITYLGPNTRLDTVTETSLLLSDGSGHPDELLEAFAEDERRSWRAAAPARSLGMAKG